MHPINMPSSCNLKKRPSSPAGATIPFHPIQGLEVFSQSNPICISSALLWGFMHRTIIFGVVILFFHFSSFPLFIVRINKQRNHPTLAKERKCISVHRVSQNSGVQLSDLREQSTAH
ncbi:hypothetical protein, unlikely [Trypanosoma congolense IL3000]|uniref:Uncharacterized protein n=1 Tax=Trypanosoma congolense (strain IL3000) TaxID=1068625 RepID=F9WG78_TRYCI|nr:hypothetical protein, unlikely [Trypanosoma congolense IL3000]